MKEPVWLTTRLVLSIHEEQIREHGGGFGVRDQNLMESALARPKHVFQYGTKVDIFQIASSYGYGIAKNHPFIDGNKRTAFQCMYVFLYLNGFEINAPEVDAVVTMLGVADGSVSESQLAEWLKENHEKI